MRPAQPIAMARMVKAAGSGPDALTEMQALLGT